MNTNLDYLHEAKHELERRGLKQAQTVDDFLIGILSCSVPEQAWKAAVDHAVRLASKRAASDGERSR